MSNDEGSTSRLPSAVATPGTALIAATDSLRLPRPAQDSETHQPTTAYPSASPPDLTLHEFLRVVVARRWLVASLAIIVASLGIAARFLEAPVYKASVRLQIDRQPARIVDAGGVSPAEASDNESLRTQYEILRSRSMAERAAKIELAAGSADRDLQHSSLLAIVRAWLGASHSPRAAPPDPASSAYATASIIAANILVRPVPGSRLVDIVYTDSSPERAARIINNFADAYISHVSDKRTQSSAYARAFLGDQSQQLLVRLRQSEDALLKFSEMKEIVLLGEKTTATESNLAAAYSSLNSLSADRMRSEQIWRQVDAHTDIDLPQFLSNAAIQQLRAARKTLQTEYQEKLGTFRPSYPAMREIAAKLKEIDRQISAEVAAIKASLKGAYEAALRQETETKAQVESLRAELINHQRHLIEYNNLKREADANRSLYNGLVQRLKEVEVASAVAAGNVFIVDRAEVPATPISTSLSRMVLLWLGLGLGAGVTAALLAETLDGRVRTPEQLERIAVLPTIGVIPMRTLSLPTALYDPNSPMADAYRSVSASLRLALGLGSRPSLLVTSAGRLEGKSTTALSIARQVAMTGARVLLIDADLRKPTLHTMLRCDNAVGLGACLSYRCSPYEVMQATDLDTLAFIPAGPLAHDAIHLLSGPQLNALLSSTHETFDFTIIDGPPVLGAVETQFLASATTFTLLVAAAGRARPTDVRGAVRSLSLARSRVIGTVMTMLEKQPADSLAR